MFVGVRSKARSTACASPLAQVLILTQREFFPETTRPSRANHLNGNSSGAFASGGFLMRNAIGLLNRKRSLHTPGGIMSRTVRAQNDPARSHDTGGGESTRSGDPNARGRSAKTSSRAAAPCQKEGTQGETENGFKAHLARVAKNSEKRLAKYRKPNAAAALVERHRAKSERQENEMELTRR
jgi:hypothetical protein